MSYKWALMKRFDIADRTNPDEIYLRRWRIIQTPWFALFLHKINLPDNDRDLHDHPYNFISIILRGGYRECLSKTGLHTPNNHCEFKEWRAGSVHRMKGEWFHKISRLDRKPTWTLLLVGRRRRKWGFDTPQGWVAWEDYERGVHRP